MKKTASLVILAFALGFIFGAIFIIRRPPPPRMFGVLQEDIDLRSVGIVNQPMYGIIKKGTIVETGNIVKGGSVGFEVGGWVYQDKIKFIGNGYKLRDYFTEHQDMYSEEIKNRMVAVNRN